MSHCFQCCEDGKLYKAEDTRGYRVWLCYFCNFDEDRPDDEEEE